MSSDCIERVAVIGAGIAGLAAAACLKQLITGVREVVVFDPHEDIVSYNVGGALGVSGGAAILERIGFLSDLKQHSFPMSKIQASFHEEILLELSLPHLQSALCSSLLEEDGDGAPMIYATRWMKLREVLFKATKDQRRVNHFKPKPGAEESEESATLGVSDGTEQETRVVIVPKKKLVEITEDTDTAKVTVHFDDESGFSDFDLVVGCDGVRSNVRNFTSHPYETIVAALPFGDYLPGAYGTLDTGVRVMQCVTPTRSDCEGSDEEESKGIAIPESVAQICEQGLRQWCGNGANFLTLAFGDADDPHYVLAAIYRDRPDLRSEHEDNAGWAPEEHHREKVKQLLKDAGYKDDHTLCALLHATCQPGGLIFDLGLQDNALPLRSLSSKTGRVILMGDSAHCMSPFLGQGANQALQDAFSLAALVYEYNHGESLPDVKLMNEPKHRMVYLPGWEWLYKSAYYSLKAGLEYYFSVAVQHPTRIQRMAYEYERRRKFHAWLITLGSRMMGAVETLGGFIGLQIKLLFFRMLMWTGLIKLGSFQRCHRLCKQFFALRQLFFGTFGFILVEEFVTLLIVSL